MDRDGFLQGVRLFNRTEFFAAHEVWEDVWRAAPCDEKLFLQGLIQVAVALHHHSTGNRAGAISVLERATRNLTECREPLGDIALPEFLTALRVWRLALAGSTSPPALPQVRLVGG
jgi:predicted metal-dependent hydrolase